MARPIVMHILQDSGAPEGSTDYTTVILIHGFTWHSGIFAKLVPLAKPINARVVLINRRGYPGAVPYTPEEREALHAVGEGVDPSVVRDKLLRMSKEQARELYDLLVHFITNNDIPPARPEANAGGLILVGWSYGTAWITSLLANVASFPVNDVELSGYVRRVVWHDPPYHLFGFPPVEDAYNPMTDPTIPPEDRTHAFADWVSGYYAHGETPEEYERRTPLASPPPTLSTLTTEERASAFYPEPGNPGGSDSVYLFAAIRCGLFAVLRDGALALTKAKSPSAEEDEERGDSWRDVEMRYIWCDRSVWEMPWSVWNMNAEVNRAKKRLGGGSVRNVTFLRLKGANHFVHWDEPERTLKALLVDDTTGAL